MKHDFNLSKINKYQNWIQSSCNISLVFIKESN